MSAAQMLGERPVRGKVKAAAHILLNLADTEGTHTNVTREHHSLTSKGNHQSLLLQFHMNIKATSSMTLAAKGGYL